MLVLELRVKINRDKNKFYRILCSDPKLKDKYDRLQIVLGSNPDRE